MNENKEILKYPELPVIEIVDDLVQVYKEYMVVKATLQLGFFDWLNENGPATPEEICSGTGVKPEFIGGLLGTLYYLDMVRRSDDMYSLSPASKMYFVSSGDYYQGDYILGLSISDTPWAEISDYLTHPELKKTFEPLNYGGIKSRSEQLIRGTVQNVVNILRTIKQFNDAKTLLEIGGGTGLYAIAACQANPSLKAFVSAREDEATIAEENIASYKMENRITILTEDIWIDKVKPVDIALISHALYPFRDSLDGITSHITTLIKPGGLILSNHWFSAPPVGNGMQGLYELELAIHAKYHRLPPRDEFEKVCKKNGLSLLQAGVIRSQYGESTIHILQKTE